MSCELIRISKILRTVILDLDFQCSPIFCVSEAVYQGLDLIPTVITSRYIEQIKKVKQQLKVQITLILMI